MFNKSKINFREKEISKFLNTKEYKSILFAYFVIPLYLPNDIKINKPIELSKIIIKNKLLKLLFPTK